MGVLIEALRLDREPLDSVLRRALDAIGLGVGGFILFGGEREDVASLLKTIQDACSRPLWLASDLERGVGQQIAGATALPPPAALARHPDPLAAVRLAGSITGAEAAELGINWVLAPVLDLDWMGDNPIVGTRSFGADADDVGRLGRAWIEACQAEGPAACAKHFPGHGRTLSDSHLELPVVTAPAEELMEDIAPFAAVADVAATMMAAHVAYPALSGSVAKPAHPHPVPASRDPGLIRGLLRSKIGFQGIVASDALIMSGFAERGAEGEAAVAAINAGCDLLLYPHDLVQTGAALAREADRDPGFAERLAAAHSRSRVARAEGPRRAAAGGRPRRPDDEVQLGRLAEWTVVCREPVTGSSAGARDTAGRVALRRGEPVVILVVSDDPEGQGHELGRPFAEALRELGWEARLEREGVGGVGAAEQAVLLLAASPRAFKGRAGLSAATLAAVQEALSGRERGGVIPVVLGHARLLEGLDVAGICAWAPEPIMERAAARWLDERARPAVERSRESR
jgi:beta-glucosidase-like glycosyl hydrolase